MKKILASIMIFITIAVQAQWYDFIGQLQFDPNVTTPNYSKGMTFYERESDTLAYWGLVPNAVQFLPVPNFSNKNFVEGMLGDARFHASTAHFTTGNNAIFDNGGSLNGIFAISAGAPDQLYGDKVFKYIDVHINDWIAHKPIVLPNAITKSSMDISFSLRYNYTGNSGDMGLRIKCVTDSSLLLDGTNTTAAINIGQNKINGTVHVPKGCTSILFGYQGVVTNAGGILLFDELVVNDYNMPVKVYESSKLVNAGTIDMIQEGASPMSKGGVVNDTVKYSRQGRWLTAYYTYRQNTGGGGGSGIYLFSLPDGLEIDLSVLTATSSTSINNTRTGGDVIGRGHAEAGGLISPVEVLAHNSTQVKLYTTSVVGDTGSAHSWSSDVVSGDTAFSLVHSNVLYKFNIRVPIVGWEDYSEHVVTASTLSGTTETKYLSAYQTADDPDVADLKFTGLEIGAEYEVSGKLQYYLPSGARVSLGFHDGQGTSYSSMRKQQSGSSDVAETITSHFTFVAKSAEMITEMAFAGGGGVNGNGTNTQTHFQLTRPITKANILNLTSPKTAYIKPSTSHYGGVGITATTAWKTRTLESISGDASFLSLSSNQITIDAGTYDLAVPVGAYDGTSWMNLNLRNVTDSVDNIFQRVTHTNTGDGVTYNTVFTTIIVTKPTTFDFRTTSTTAAGQEFLGQIKITKVR